MADDKVKKLKLVRWVDAGYPPIDLNANITAINELVAAFKEQEKLIAQLRLRVTELENDLDEQIEKSHD